MLHSADADYQFPRRPPTKLWDRIGRTLTRHATRGDLSRRAGEVDVRPAFPLSLKMR